MSCGLAVLVGIWQYDSSVSIFTVGIAAQSGLTPLSTETLRPGSHLGPHTLVANNPIPGSLGPPYTKTGRVGNIAT